MSKLTPKQEQYCQEYIIDLNQTEAAKRAGYSDKTAHAIASRMMNIPAVAARIQELMDTRAKKVSIDAEYVLGKIVETVERCSQATEVEVFDYETKSMMKTGEWKFEHNGVLKGCELLGKHLKLFTDVFEHKDGGLADRLAKARKRIGEKK